MHVYDQVGRTIQLVELQLGHAIALAVIVNRVKCPPVLEIKSPHNRRQVGDCYFCSVVILRLHEHSWRMRMRFNIVNVISQALKANQVVHVLPDHTGNRHLADHPQDYDLFLGTNVHVPVSLSEVASASAMAAVSGP